MYDYKCKKCINKICKKLKRPCCEVCIPKICILLEKPCEIIKKYLFSNHIYSTNYPFYWWQGQWYKYKKEKIISDIIYPFLIDRFPSWSKFKVTEEIEKWKKVFKIIKHRM